MKRLGILLAVLAVACGGGPRQPGALANETYFWRIVSSTVDFGQCSDDAQFRKDAEPLGFEASSFLIYKVEPDGKTAIRQTCTRVEASACMPSTMSPVTFTVANPELIFTSESKSDFGTEGCKLKDNTTWLLTDQGDAGTLELSHVLTLTDNATACEKADKQFKMQSPNRLGLEGCVVTFKLGLNLNQN